MDNKTPEHVSEEKLPERTLLNSVVILLRLNSVDIDEERLIQGLPLVDGVLPKNMLERSTLRLGYSPMWTAKELSAPCCVPMKSGGYSVVIGVAKNEVQVLKSESPNTYASLPQDEFFQLHERHFLQLFPSMEFLRDKYAGQSSKKHWFWGRLFLHKSQIFDVIASSFFANLLAVMVSLFALQVYDRVIPGQSEATLWVLAGGVGLAIMFEALLRISRARVIDHMGKEAEVDITSDIFSKVLGMRLDKRPAAPGSIVHMAREFSAIKEFFTVAAVGVVADLPFVFIFLALIYGVAGNVVWVIVVGALLTVVPSFWLQRRMAKLSAENMGGMLSASRLLTEAAYGLETVKVSRSEAFFQKQWEEIIALNAIKTTEQRSLSAFLSYWAVAMQQSTYVLAVIAGVYMVFFGEFTMGTIIAVSILSTRTLSPIAQLSQVLSKWQNMKTALNAIDKLMHSEQEQEPTRNYIRRSRVSGQLELNRINFAHPNSETTTLSIGGLKIERGMRLVVLGANGSGKSTLLRLLAGLFEPQEGKILVDGLDMRQIDPSDVRRNIGYLPQEVRMFRGSLRENLAPSHRDIGDDILLEALSFGGLGEFVKKHAEGLDLQISDGGDGLSIGQRQSIGIARLYLQDPAIVLMDEPTAALDQRLEDAVVTRLGEWIGARTCVVATHRLQIVSQMTHVAVLQGGKVIKFGERDSIIRTVSAKSLPHTAKVSNA